jgi:prepilin-type processing-associated H-X9-DG protein
MKPRLSQRPEAGLTLFEVGVIVAVLMIVVALILPTLRPRRFSGSVAARINCVNNLKQVGLAAKIWEGDHGDILPGGISVTNGGSMEMVETGNVVQTFLVMSNELSTAKILYCPADAVRAPAMMFGGLGNSNISYFAGVDATNDSNPQAILAGDSDLELRGTAAAPGLLAVGPRDPITWTALRHGRWGNLGLADGSVQQAASPYLRHYFDLSGFDTNRLAIP